MSGSLLGQLPSQQSIINKIQAKDEKHKSTNVRVICRIKPLNYFQQPIDMKIDKQNSEISISQPRQETTKTFTFNRIFTDQPQQYFVHQVCSPILKRAINDKQGYLIFSYGVTNSGKTHTILGNQDEPGILPYLVKKLSQRQKVYLSAIQLYNDEFFSLVNRQKLIPKQQNGFLDFDSNLTSEVINQQNMDQKFKQYINNRTQFDTKLNPKSSRSHAIFRIKAGQVNIGVVDLAGSQRTNRVFASVDQTSNINKSLLCLGKCIKALNQNPQSHIPIPYRQSKLTKVLFQYFAVKVQVLMIANINQSQIFYHQNMKVLDYAVLAKDIRHCSTQNSLKKNQFKFKTKKVDVFETLYKSAMKSAIAHKSLKSSRTKGQDKFLKSNMDKKDMNKKFQRALKTQQLKLHIQKFDSSQQTFDYMVQYMHQKEFENEIKQIQKISKFVYHSPNIQYTKKDTSNKKYQQRGVGRSQHSVQLMKKELRQQIKSQFINLLEKERLQKMQSKQTTIGQSLLKKKEVGSNQSIPLTPLKLIQTPQQQNFVTKTSNAIYSSVKKILKDKVHSLKNIIPNFKKNSSTIRNKKLTICNYGQLYFQLFKVQQIQNQRYSDYSFQNKKNRNELKNQQSGSLKNHLTTDSQTQTQQQTQQPIVHYEKITQQTGIQTDDQNQYPSLQIHAQQTNLAVNNNQVFSNYDKENVADNQIEQCSQNEQKQQKHTENELKPLQIKKNRMGRPPKNKTKKYNAAERVAETRKLAAKISRQQSRTPLKKRLRSFANH